MKMLQRTVVRYNGSLNTDPVLPFIFLLWEVGHPFTVFFMDGRFHALRTKFSSKKRDLICFI